jgi:catechol 2,3-dioxygenase-like lactoylglutathione lyase family enzyme
VPWVGQPVPHAGHVPQSLDRQPVALPDGSGVDPDQHASAVTTGVSMSLSWRASGGPEGSKVEAFGPDSAINRHFTTGPVAGFLVDDIRTATAELRSAGVEILFESGLDDSGNAWVHFRAPDGNICEFTQDPGISRPHERGP